MESNNVLGSSPTGNNKRGVEVVKKSLDKQIKKLISIKTSQLVALELKAEKINKKRKRGDKVSTTELIRIAISEYLNT